MMMRINPLTKPRSILTTFGRRRCRHHGWLGGGDSYYNNKSEEFSSSLISDQRFTSFSSLSITQSSPMKIDAATTDCSTVRVIRRMRSSSSSSKDDADDSPSSSSTEWRKHQLDKLEQKFATTNTQTTKKEAPGTIMKIENEDELQPMWKQMESRVTKRRSKTLAETGGKSGRSNIKRTDEEMWLKEGLYDDAGNENDNKNNRSH